jgi:hypothetical protein
VEAEEAAKERKTGDGKKHKEARKRSEKSAAAAAVLISEAARWSEKRRKSGNCNIVRRSQFWQMAESAAVFSLF